MTPEAQRDARQWALLVRPWRRRVTTPIATVAHVLIWDGGGFRAWAGVVPTVREVDL